jgi:SAM-dependent methyltransferase
MLHTRLRSPKLTALIERKKGIQLDVGCSSHKQEGWVGMDRRKCEGVDIVHDLEVIPYPLPDHVCTQILCSHVMEHLNPKLHVDIMDEFWRIMKPGGMLWLSMPYPNSRGHWQDPTHIKPWNEVTPTYFDPTQPMFQVYQPRPWQIVSNQWQSSGNIEIRMKAIKEVPSASQNGSRSKKT